MTYSTFALVLISARLVAPQQTLKPQALPPLFRSPPASFFRNIADGAVPRFPKDRSVRGETKRMVAPTEEGGLSAANDVDYAPSHSAVPPLRKEMDFSFSNNLQPCGRASPSASSRSRQCPVTNPVPVPVPVTRGLVADGSGVGDGWCGSVNKASRWRRNESSPEENDAQFDLWRVASWWRAVETTLPAGGRASVAVTTWCLPVQY